ncbi:hypothetical protein EXIGLDRAFT_719675 [Exidia glandulosa HHB12029]|uniref:Uncharacterized protein n=1 Tax=Exidia glandulosa HHB12029 TaxID=1314781 RepID=A0A165GXC7_EXIGL|nr:hypothetical protein EXIGLDRAFT_719675 [Exidia glandulosa HHB12029]
MSAKTRGKTTTASRKSEIPLSDIDFLDTDEDEPASSSSRKKRPTVDDDDDELEVVPYRPKKRPRVEYPTIERIVRATPRAGAADISTRLQHIEAAQTKLATLFTTASASTEQLKKGVQKLEKSNADALKRLERVEALLEKVLERLG